MKKIFIKKLGKTDKQSIRTPGRILELSKEPGDEADPYRTINNRSIRESRDNLLLGPSRNANGSHHSSLESLKS